MTSIILETAHIRRCASLKGQCKTVCLTAYSAPIMRELDPHRDLLLVGGSLVMVVNCMGTIQRADFDMMIWHCQEITRRQQKVIAIIVSPASSYQDSPEQALDENGVVEVKPERGSHMTGHAAMLVYPDISVLADIGLLPQKVTSKSGFPIPDHTDEEAEQLATDVSATCDAGVFGIAIEGIIAPVAVSITAMCPIPSIGIGTSPAFNGQILVAEEILGLYERFTPKSAEKYTDLSTYISVAAAAFHKTVVNETFPLDKCFLWPKN